MGGKPKIPGIVPRDDCLNHLSSTKEGAVPLFQQTDQAGRIHNQALDFVFDELKAFVDSKPEDYEFERDEIIEVGRYYAIDFLKNVSKSSVIFFNEVVQMKNFVIRAVLFFLILAAILYLIVGIQDYIYLFPIFLASIFIGIIMHLIDTK